MNVRLGVSMETRTEAHSPNAGKADRRWWILAVLCLSVLLVVVDNTIVNVALPTISRSRGARPWALEGVGEAYPLPSPGLLLPGGNRGAPLARGRFLQPGLG